LVWGSDVHITDCEQSQQASPLFDHLVGAQQERLGYRETESLRGGQVDREVELGRLLDWDVAGSRSAQDLVD
jgi:hypothetical protein